jgi:uncharacterized protein (TIGR02145 family)
MKFIRQLWILIFYFFIILLTGCQPVEIILHGELTGTVKDSRTNEPVSAAAIILTELNDTTYTDINGAFLFRNLIPGNYRINIAKQHYANLEENVTVESAKSAKMDVDLEPIPVLQYSTSLLDFGYYNTSVSFLITKSDIGNISYLITPGQSWITVIPTSGDIDTETDTITVSVNRSKLIDKIYNGWLVIKSAYQQYTSQDTIDIFAGVHRINFNEDFNYGTVTDIEGTVYKTIEIGTQTWMAENLKTTRYNNDVPIPEVTDSIAWENLETPGYCWYDNDSTTHRAISGALYNGYAVESGDICPTGWHVPTDDDCNTLIEFIGGSTGAGIKVKETGGLHWDPSISATNEFGFTLVPSGYRKNKIFRQYESTAIFWTSTDYVFGQQQTIYSLYTFLTGGVRINDFYLRTDPYPQIFKNEGYSIRCIKDSNGK